MSANPLRQVIDPRSAAEIRPRDPGQSRIEGRLLGEQGGLPY
jgi:hypothetical protein